MVTSAWALVFHRFSKPSDKCDRGKDLDFDPGELGVFVLVRMLILTLFSENLSTIC